MKKTLALIIIVSNWAVAQNNDTHFPGRGKFNTGIITTYNSFAPPPVLIGDVTYGVTNKVSLGIIGGTQGSLALLGPKVNVLLAQPSNHFRYLFRFFSVYYFERNGQFLFDRSSRQVMPWILSMATFDCEWKTPKGIRWSLGMGGFETHCVDGMMSMLSGRKETAEDKEHDLPLELFNTVQASASFPVTKKLTLRIETIFAMKGYQLIKAGEFKVASPINPFVNFTYTF
jgi:hypothetical protein